MKKQYIITIEEIDNSVKITREKIGLNSLEVAGLLQLELMSLEHRYINKSTTTENETNQNNKED